VSVLDRKLLRELRGAGLLLAAIASILAIGVAMYVALGTAHRNLSHAQQRYYARCRMADFWIEVKKVPLTELEPLARLPGVVEIQPRLQSLVTIDMEHVEQPLNGLVLSLPDQRTKVINDIVLKRGSYFTLARQNEAIVNEAFARRHGLRPGQALHVILNNRRQELVIVGTAVSSEFTYLVGPGSIVPDPDHFGVCYIKQSFAEEVLDFQGSANQVLGRLAPAARARPQEVLRRAELLLEEYGVFSATPLAEQSSHRFLANEIQGLEAFGVINPAIFLAVAVMVLNVLISRLVDQQRVVVGTFKALGYTDGELFWHFAKFGLAVGTAGGLAGCVLGHLLAEAMTALYRLFFEFPTLHNEFYGRAHLIGLLLGIACGVMGTTYGARHAVRLQPAEAMRPRAPQRGGAIALERVRWLWRRLSFGWRMTIRNVVRQRLRSAAGIFAAAMGSCLAMNALLLARASEYMVHFQLERVQRSDLDLVFRDAQGLEAWDEARRLPGVDHAEPVFDLACTLRHGHRSHKGGIQGLAAGAWLTMPRDASGQRVRLPPWGLVLARRLAEKLDVQRGGWVIVEPTQGLRRPVRAPVVEITDSYLGMAAYADLTYLNRLVGEELSITGVQLSVTPEWGLRRQLYRELKQLPAVQAVAARADMIRTVRDTLVKNQRVFIGLLVLFSGVIFFGSVLNSSLVSLAEREREVATLLVVGYTPWQVGGLFLRESMLTNLTGTVLGLPLGYLLSVGITIAYDTEMFRIPVVDPTAIGLVTLCLGMAFGLLAHACVQWSIFKLDWLEALKTKE